MRTAFERNNNNTRAGWSIEFAEKPLSIGPIDNLVYDGRDASHSFLRIRNPIDEITAELHGFSFDSQKSERYAFNFNPFKRLRHTFNREDTPQYEPNYLRVFAYDFERTQHPELTTQSLFEGNEEEVLRRWTIAKKAGVEINSREREYFPFNLFDLKAAQNCHTVSWALIAAMGFQAPETAFAAPGFHEAFHETANVFFRHSIARIGDLCLKGLRVYNHALDNHLILEDKSMYADSPGALTVEITA